MLKNDKCPACGEEFKRVRALRYGWNIFNPTIVCPKCGIELKVSFPFKRSLKVSLRNFVFVILPTIMIFIILISFEVSKYKTYGITVFVATALLYVHFKIYGKEFKELDESNRLIIKKNG